MKELKEYSIAWEGLKLGHHEFNFVADAVFFSHFENSAIDRANLVVDLDLEKQNTMLILDFHVYGQVIGNCDRCLDDLNIPINTGQKLIVKFGETAEELEENVIVIPHGQNELKLGHYIYEFSVLALPGKTIHDEISDCDQEVIKKLENNNNADKGIDPRWEKLTELSTASTL